MSRYSSTNYSINASLVYSSHYYTPDDHASLKQTRLNNNSTFDLTSLEYTTGMKPKSSSPLKIDQRVHILPGTNKNQYQIPIPALLMKPPMISDQNRVRNTQMAPQVSPLKNNNLSYIPTTNHNSSSPVSNQSSTFSRMDSPTRSVYSSNATSEYVEEKSSSYSQNILLKHSPQLSEVKMSPLEERFKYAEHSQQSLTYDTDYLPMQEEKELPSKIPVFSDNNYLTNTKVEFKRFSKKLPEEPKLTYEDESMDLLDSLSINSNDYTSKQEKGVLSQDESETGWKSQKSNSPMLSENSFDINSNYRMNQTAKRLTDESTFNFDQLVQLNQSIDTKPNAASNQCLVQDENEEIKAVEKTKRKHKFWFFGLRKKFSDKPSEPVNIFTKREVPIELFTKDDTDKDSLNDLINGDNDVEENFSFNRNGIPVTRKESVAGLVTSVTKSQNIQSPNVISFMDDRNKYNLYISNQSYSASILSSIACCEENSEENFDIKNSKGIIIFSSTGTETPNSENEELTSRFSSDNKMANVNDKQPNILSLESGNSTLLGKRNTRLRKSGLPIKETSTVHESKSRDFNYDSFYKTKSNDKTDEDYLGSDEEADATEQYSPINENISFFENSQLALKNKQVKGNEVENFAASIKAYADSIKNYTSSLASDIKLNCDYSQIGCDGCADSDDEYLKDINNDYSVAENLKETLIVSQMDEETLFNGEQTIVCGDDSSFYGDEREITKKLVVTPTFHPDKNSFYQDDSPYTEFIKDIIPTYGFLNEKEYNPIVNVQKIPSISKSLRNVYGKNPVQSFSTIPENQTINLMQSSSFGSNISKLEKTRREHNSCVSNKDLNESAPEVTTLCNLESGNIKGEKGNSRDFSFATSVCSDVEFQQNIGSFAEIRKNNYANAQRQIQARMPSITDSVIYFKESDLVHQPYEIKDTNSDWETVGGNSRISSITSNESTLLSAVNSLYKDYISRKGYKNIQEMCINNAMTLPAAIRQIKTEL